MTQKSIFPHRFITNRNLNYIGPVPAFCFFDGITETEYNDYASKFNNNWSFKNESIKYCENDCISLYEVMQKYIVMIFDLFKNNVNKCPTLPSLAWQIFRSNFPPKYFIPMLSGKIAKDIRSSFTGGATDMYTPKNKEGELIYGYDVNSLYPSVMAKYPMPVGKPTYFEGDIRKYQPDSFGFFHCKVTAPKFLLHPIIQVHIKTKSGLRTMAPLGTF